MEKLSIGGRAQALGIVISILCVAGIVWWAAGQEAPELPTGSDLLLVAAGIGLYGVATLFRGERWFNLLEAAHSESKRVDAYALTAVGYMGNNILPARAGDAIRVVLQTPRSSASARTVIGTIIAERLADVLFLLTLFVVLAYGVLSDLDTPGGTVLAAITGGGVILLTLLFVLVKVTPDHPRIKQFKEWVMPMLRPSIGLRGAHGAQVAALTAAIWVVEITTFVVVIDSAGPHLSFLDGAYLVAVASVFVLIPSGPGYLGTFDAAILLGLEALDVTGSEAVSSVLLLRFVLTVPITVVGFVILLARYGGWSTVVNRNVERT